MSNYVPITDFSIKDSLASGNPNKIASGTQIQAEHAAIATAIATKEDTANKNVANGYAGLDSGGLVPDARIDVIIPRLALDNIFTGVLSISNSQPSLSLRETDAGTDVKNWLVRANSVFAISTATDAAPTVAVNNWVTVSRTGTTIGAITLTGTSLTFNGSGIWHTGNDGSGSGLDADTVDGQHASAFAASSHAHDTSSITSGTFADARIAQSNVTQHQGALTTRNISGKAGTGKTLSTSAASGGSDGDIWYRY